MSGRGSWVGPRWCQTNLIERWFRAVSHPVPAIQISCPLASHDLLLKAYDMFPQNFTHREFWTNLSMESSFFPVTFWSPKWRSLNPWKGHLRHPKRSLGRTWILKLVLDTGAYYGTWNIHGTTNSPLGAWLNNEVLMDPWRKANLRYTLIYRMC